MARPGSRPGRRKGLLHWAQQGDMATPCEGGSSVEQWIHDMVGSFLAYFCLHLTIVECLKGPCPGIITTEVNWWGQCHSGCCSERCLVRITLFLQELPLCAPSLSGCHFAPMPCSPAECCWHRGRGQLRAGNAIKAQVLLTWSHSSCSGTGFCRHCEDTK